MHVHVYTCMYMYIHACPECLLFNGNLDQMLHDLVSLPDVHEDREAMSLSSGLHCQHVAQLGRLLTQRLGGGVELQGGWNYRGGIKLW